MEFSWLLCNGLHVDLALSPLLSPFRLYTFDHTPNSFNRPYPWFVRDCRRDVKRFQQIRFALLVFLTHLDKGSLLVSSKTLSTNQFLGRKWNVLELQWLFTLESDKPAIMLFTKLLKLDLSVIVAYVQKVKEKMKKKEIRKPCNYTLPRFYKLYQK